MVRIPRIHSQSSCISILYNMQLRASTGVHANQAFWLLIHCVHTVLMMTAASSLVCGALLRLEYKRRKQN